MSPTRLKTTSVWQKEVSKSRTSLIEDNHAAQVLAFRQVLERTASRLQPSLTPA